MALITYSFTSKVQRAFLELLYSPCEGLLADFQLVQQVWQQLPHGLISDTALNHIWYLMCPCHNLHPRLIYIGKALGFLWK